MLEYVNKSIVYVRIHKQKTPINMYSRNKTQQIAVTDMREKPVDIFIVPLVRL